MHDLAEHGAHVKIFRPERWWRLERRLLRRLHRKLAVVDDVLAFVGGINIIDDHHHPEGVERLGPRFDFAVRVEGPLVAAVALTMQRLWWTLELVDPHVQLGALPRETLQPRPGGYPGGVAAALLLRDNLRYRRTIEAAYLQAIGGAREEIVIANAYFIPTRRFRRALRRAAARGVRVRLLLQGRVEYALQHYAQQALYGQLLDAGIEIHEYQASYLHAKVAVVDRQWATVGSSNIDPYSLLLAREANVAVFDRRFAVRLTAELDYAIAHDARPLHPTDLAKRGFIARSRDWIAYMLVGIATATLARARNY
jgi:cardiolipin synthase